MEGCKAGSDDLSVRIREGLGILRLLSWRRRRRRRVWWGGENLALLSWGGSKG